VAFFFAGDFVGGTNLSYASGRTWEAKDGETATVTEEMEPMEMQPCHGMHHHPEHYHDLEIEQRDLSWGPVSTKMSERNGLFTIGQLKMIEKLFR